MGALVLQETVVDSIRASPAWRTTTSEIDNTPTVVWNFRKAAIINPVVSDLLVICSAHIILQKITQSMFYHPGQLNTMAEDASCHFNLSLHPFLALFH